MPTDGFLHHDDGPMAMFHTASGGHEDRVEDRPRRPVVGVPTAMDSESGVKVPIPARIAAETRRRAVQAFAQASSPVCDAGEASEAFDLFWSISMHSDRNLIGAKKVDLAFAPVPVATRTMPISHEKPI